VSKGRYRSTVCSLSGLRVTVFACATEVIGGVEVAAFNVCGVVVLVLVTNETSFSTLLGSDSQYEE